MANVFKRNCTAINSELDSSVLRLLEVMIHMLYPTAEMMEKLKRGKKCEGNGGSRASEWEKFSEKEGGIEHEDESSLGGTSGSVNTCNLPEHRFVEVISFQIYLINV